MGLIRLFVELVITLGGSFAAWWIVGTKLYVFVGMLMAIIMLGLVYSSRARKPDAYDPLLEDHTTPLWARALLGVTWTTIIGVFWPVLPVVLAWRRSRDAIENSASARADDAAQPKGTARPSGPEAR